jgi:ketosteroid isomerase-like protein
MSTYITTEQDILAAVEVYRKAMIAADGEALNSIASDDLSYGHSDADIQTKAQFVHSLTSGKSVFVTLQLDCLHMQVLGNVAIMRHHFIANTADGGIHRNVNIRILWVWQQNNGQWQMLARQAVKIPS